MKQQPAMNDSYRDYFRALMYDVAHAPIGDFSYTHHFQELFILTRTKAYRKCFWVCLLGHTLVISIYVLYATVLFDPLVKQYNPPPLQSLHFSLVTTLITLTEYFFLRCCFTSPGYVTDSVPPAPSTTYCTRCSLHRPLRARHCRISNKCVLKFDHFCPWMNNTIGLLNYRYFVLTLVFLDAVVLVGLLTACRPFLDIYFNDNEVIEQVKNSLFSDEIPLATKCIVLLTPFLGGIYVLISSLLAWHIR